VIVRDQTVMSLKLRKQLKALERKEKHVFFGIMLEEVAQRINTPKQRRNRK
jgi:hypothetical protein